MDLPKNQPDKLLIRLFKKFDKQRRKENLKRNQSGEKKKCDDEINAEKNGLRSTQVYYLNNNEEK